MQPHSRNHFRSGKAISIQCYECVPVFLLYLSGMLSACAVLYCQLWPLRFYDIFYVIIKGRLFGEKVIGQEMFSLIFSTTFI